MLDKSGTLTVLRLESVANAISPTLCAVRTHIYPPALPPDTFSLHLIAKSEAYSLLLKSIETSKSSSLIPILIRNGLQQSFLPNTLLCLKGEYQDFSRKQASLFRLSAAQTKMSFSSFPEQVKRIPTVGQLCELLGFRQGSEERRSAKEFQKLTHKYRRQYQTTKGIEGKSLMDIKSPEVVQQLEKMAAGFLESDSQGAKLWPQSGPNQSHDIPKYPDDRVK